MFKKLSFFIKNEMYLIFKYPYYIMSIFYITYFTNKKQMNETILILTKILPSHHLGIPVT